MAALKEGHGSDRGWEEDSNDGPSERRSCTCKGLWMSTYVESHADGAVLI